MPLLPIRSLVIPLAAALAIIAMAGTTAASRSANQHADCKVVACTATVIR